MAWLAAWWRQPDHFDWLTGYLQSQGLSTSARRIFAWISASLALYPADVFLGPATFRSTELVIAVPIGAVGLAMAAFWLLRWPTRGQSIFLALTGSMCIAAGSLAQANPLVALMACSALTIPGGYLAFFHTARYVSVNFLLAGIVGIVEATRLAAAGQQMLAINGFFLLVELNVVMPLGIRAVVRALGVDLLRIDRDPLTGLLNRRACDRAIVGRILASADHAFLVMAIVDLDRFKDLNDSQGHAAGDAALVAVARALTDACRDTAVIGRVGGEEFLIADILKTEPSPQWGQQICDAVAATGLPVTASLGIATLALSGIGSDEAEQAYRQLIAHADTAMYEAKRRGGNHARNHRA